MSKELESLNYVWYNYYTEELSQDEVEQIEKHLNIVQDGLKRLESIDNSNPSEALEELFKTTYFGSKEEYDKINNCYNSIKQTLLKYQQQEKTLKIIFEKGLPLGEIDMIKQSNTYNEYNIKFSWANFKNISVQKTEEEFKILKEALM